MEYWYRDIILDTARLESPINLEYIDFNPITPELLKTRIKKLKPLVDGSQRDALEKKINSNIQQCSELHSDSKLGQLIQLMSGKPKEELDLQILPSEEEGLIIDHYRIQHKVISYFKDWHCISKTLDPAADCLATHPLFWQSFLKKQNTPNF
jgi:hypothetical protein